MRKLMLWSIAAALATSSLVVAAEPVVPPPPGGDYSAYSGNPVDLAAREAWLEQRIQLGDANGAISRIEAEHDFDTLGGIRRFHAKKSDEKGGLSGEDRARILNKLDNLTAIVRSQWA